jgi:hypothetical protein
LNLPQTIIDYWTANRGNLPHLWLEYAPATDTPPIAIMEPTGFAREHANKPFYFDTHKYRFTVLATDAVEAYENGFAAIAMMNDFTCAGFINLTIQPEQYATPFSTGQANIWAFEFSIDFLVTPS